MRRLILSLLGAALLTGCGSDSGPQLEFIPVKGVVTFDGKGLPNADVTAIPQGKTMGQGGSARTNENGEFEIAYARGGKGLPEGEYLATVSRRLNPDGTSPPPNDPTPPMDSPAVEKLPPKYVDPTQSALRIKVSKAGAEANLTLTSGK